jgi:hypothetical protein
MKKILATIILSLFAATIQCSGSLKTWTSTDESINIGKTSTLDKNNQQTIVYTLFYSTDPNTLHNQKYNNKGALIGSDIRICNTNTWIPHNTKSKEKFAKIFKACDSNFPNFETGN